MKVEIELSEQVLNEIAERVAAILSERTASGPDFPEYLDVKAAAAYLGCTVGRVRKLVERRQVPFVQDGPGCRVYLARRDLDSWMDGRRV